MSKTIPSPLFVCVYGEISSGAGLRFILQPAVLLKAEVSLSKALNLFQLHGHGRLAGPAVRECTSKKRSSLWETRRRQRVVVALRVWPLRNERWWWCDRSLTRMLSSEARVIVLGVRKYYLSSIISINDCAGWIGPTFPLWFSDSILSGYILWKVKNWVSSLIKSVLSWARGKWWPGAEGRLGQVGQVVDDAQTRKQGDEERQTKEVVETQVRGDERKHPISAICD